MNINKIKTSTYNPRKMSDNARNALKVSMSAFKDISGIVWNRSTGNLISGNHRWEELVKKHGDSAVSLDRVGEPLDDYHMILANGEFTGYLVREVDWDLDTEVAANIAANSEKLKGEFTSGVGNLLESISESGSMFPKVLFEGLRYNEMQLDFGVHTVDFDMSNDFELDDGFDDDFDDDELKTELKDVVIKDEDDVVEMAIIKVRCTMANRTEIIEKIKNSLINENDIKID